MHYGKYMNQFKNCIRTVINIKLKKYVAAAQKLIISVEIINKEIKSVKQVMYIGIFFLLTVLQ